MSTVGSVYVLGPFRSFCLIFIPPAWLSVFAHTKFACLGQVGSNLRWSFCLSVFQKVFYLSNRPSFVYITTLSHWLAVI